ncbi:MAG: hypothetical protein L0220_32815 [Acidobacteria bacterium]|nr:hypothetical protein [Acidobacteriota bacterium]
MSERNTMGSRASISDEQIIGSWYDFVSAEPGFVGYLLKLLRDQEGTTPEEQQSSFGTDAERFRHLQAMPIPRRGHLSSDAHRMAEACKLNNPFAFVQAMVLASKLASYVGATETKEYYQAAFDPEADLDEIPDKE